MESETDLFEYFELGPREEAELCIHDDGRVAYAYLHVKGKISSLVWLYNRAPAPEGTDFVGVRGDPLLNPAGFIADVPFVVPSEPSDFVISWHEIRTRSGEFMHEMVEIKLGGLVHARLATGIMPGECRLSAVANVLAKPLTDSVVPS